MRSIRSLAIALMFALPAAGAEWRLLETPHFSIYSSADQRKSERIAGDLETMVRVLEDAGLDARGGRFQAFLFGRRAEAQPYFDALTGKKGVNFTGVFAGNAAAGAMLIDTSRDRASLRTPNHELVHAVIARSGLRLPLWMEEGLSEYFTAIERNDAGQIAGLAITDHLRPMQRRRPLPLSVVFGVHSASDVYTGQARQSSFYATSWLLVHYLIDQAPGGLSSVLAAARGGASGEEILARATGKSVRAVEAELISYSRALYRAPVPRFAGRGATSAKPLWNALAGSRAEAELGFVLSRGTTAASREEAVKVLSAIPADDPAMPLARAGLAAIHLADGEGERAFRLFEEAVAQTADALPLVMYGEALLAHSFGAVPQLIGLPAPLRPRVEKADQLFARALELDRTSVRARAGAAIAAATLRGELDLLARMTAELPQRSDLSLHHLAVTWAWPEAADWVARYERLAAHPDPQVRFAAPAIRLRLMSDKVNELTSSGRASEALAILDALIEAAPGGAGRDEIVRSAATIRSTARVNEEVGTYNKAIRLSNQGEVREALVVLEALLRSA